MSWPTGGMATARPNGLPQTPVAERRNSVEDARPEGRVQIKAS